MAYPSLLFQTKDNKDILESSCKIIKIILNLIGEKYDILRDFYNSYKHGYRIIPCNSGGKKAFLYFDETEIPKIMVYEDEDLKKVFDLSGDCKKILQNIIENHKVRMRVGDSPDPVKVTLNIFSKSGEQITKKDLDKIFYNKRKDTKKEYVIEKQILKQSDNYEEYRFKWVLFDTTDKKIIAYNKELIEMIKEFYDVNTENEVSFIKINNQFIDSLKQI
jgi:hypothetical protein